MTYMKELKFKALNAQGGQEIITMYPTYSSEAVVPTTMDSNIANPQVQIQQGQIQSANGEIQTENKV